jgi:hypothetical protein
VFDPTLKRKPKKIKEIRLVGSVDPAAGPHNELPDELADGVDGETGEATDQRAVDADELQIAADL